MNITWTTSVQTLQVCCYAFTSACSTTLKYEKGYCPQQVVFRFVNRTLLVYNVNRILPVYNVNYTLVNRTGGLHATLPSGLVLAPSKVFRIKRKTNKVCD